MLATLRVPAAIMLTSFGLAACSSDMFGGGNEVTTSSVAPTQQAKSDPACTTLASRIDALRREGVADRVEQAADRQDHDGQRQARLARPDRRVEQGQCRVPGEVLDRAAACGDGCCHAGAGCCRCTSGEDCGEGCCDEGRDEGCCSGCGADGTGGCGRCTGRRNQGAVSTLSAQVGVIHRRRHCFQFEPGPRSRIGVPVGIVRRSASPSVCRDRLEPRRD